MTDSEINGYEGLYYAAKLLLTGETVMRYAEEPPTFFMFSRGRDTTEDWRALGVEWKGRMGSMGTATLDGQAVLYLSQQLYLLLRTDCV